jgi:hypothetical protein
VAFRGIEAELVLATYGLVGSKNLAAVPPNALLQAQDVALHQGTISRDGGSARATAAAVSGAASVNSLFDWWPSASLQRVLCTTDDGGILRDVGTWTFPTGMKHGMTTGGIPVWAEGGCESFGNNKLAFLTDGMNVVQVVSGDATSTVDLAIPPADWSGANQPRFLVLHNGRMWGGFQHRIYGSTTGNHANFTGTGSQQLAVFAGEGSYLQGGFSFNGVLYLWKYPRGIYWLDDTDTTTSNWLVKRRSNAVGLAGPKALDMVDNDVLFVSEIGHLHLLSGVQEWGDVRASDLVAANNLGPWITENVAVSTDALAKAEVRYYPDRKEAHVAMCGIASSVKNIRLVVDFNQMVEGKNVPRVRVAEKDTCEALALWRDGNGVQRLLSGDDVGHVWRLDQSNKDKNGADYTSTFQVPHTDFGWLDPKLASRQKNFSYLEAVMQPTGNYNLSVDVWIDGSYVETLTFNMGYSGGALGSFVLGTDRLGGDVLKNVRKRMHGSGVRLSLVGYVSAAGVDFSLSSFKVGFTPGGLKR